MNFSVSDERIAEHNRTRLSALEDGLRAPRPAARPTRDRHRGADEHRDGLPSRAAVVGVDGRGHAIRPVPGRRRAPDDRREDGGLRRYQRAGPRHAGGLHSHSVGPARVSGRAQGVREGPRPASSIPRTRTRSRTIPDSGTPTASAVSRTPTPGSGARRSTTTSSASRSAPSSARRRIPSGSATARTTPGRCTRDEPSIDIWTA